MKTKLLFLAFLTSLLSWGQILTFEFSALGGDEATATSNFNNANLTSSTISRGAGLTASANGGRFNATGWATTSIANAVSGDNYMEFTITPNSGYQFNVSSIVINLLRSATGNTQIALRSSVDGYVSNLDVVKSVTDNTSTQTFTYTFTQANSTTAVTYRFYSYAEATGGSGGIGDGAGNDIIVEGNGTVYFTGTTPQIINNVTPLGTEVFYNVVLNNNFTTAVSNDLIASGNLTVNTGRIVNVSSDGYIQVNENLINNGTFTVFNNGSLIQVNDSGVNTGNISYQRIASVKLQDYVYWSSPVSGFDVNSISPLTPAYYHWQWNPTILNPNGGEGNWVNASTTMLGGKGYIVRAPNGFSNAANQNWTATFNNGVPNNGVYTPTIARGTDLNAGTAGPNGVMRTVTDDNWNLLGNPYPSSISINSFLASNPQLDGFIRLWTHGTLPSTAILDPFYDNFVSNYTAGDYIALNGSGATSGPGAPGVIGAGQGFFVLMNPGASTTTTALFNNAMRDKGYSNSQFYRNSNTLTTAPGGDIERHRIWLDLVSPTNETTRTLVAYVEGATAEKDRMFDALTDYKSAQNFYSLIADQVMTIQGKGLPFVQEDRVPLGVKIPSNGIYKIAIATVDGLFSGNQNIYLEDKVLGVIHDLRQNPYSFSVNSGILNDRFVLRYTNETLGNEDFENNSDVLIFSSDLINIQSFNQTIQSVTIHNVLGQLLVNELNVNSDKLEIKSLQKNKAPLIVQVTLENGKKIVKKLIF